MCRILTVQLKKGKVHYRPMSIHIRNAVEDLMDVIMNMLEHSDNISSSIIKECFITSGIFAEIAEVCRRCPGDTLTASICSKFVHECLDTTRYIKSGTNIFTDLIDCILVSEIVSVLFFCVRQHNLNRSDDPAFDSLLLNTSRCSIILSLHVRAGNEHFETLMLSYGRYRIPRGCVCMALILSATTESQMNACVKKFAVDVMLRSIDRHEEFYLYKDYVISLDLFVEDIVPSLICVIVEAGTSHLKRISGKVQHCLIDCIRKGVKDPRIVEHCLVAIVFLAHKTEFKNVCTSANIESILKAAELHASNKIISFHCCRTIQLYFFSTDTDMSQDTFARLAYLMNLLLILHSRIRPIVLEAAQVVLKMTFLSKCLAHLSFDNMLVNNLLSIANLNVEDGVLFSWLCFAIGNAVSGYTLKSLDNQRRAFKIISEALECHSHSVVATSVLVHVLTQIVGDYESLWTLGSDCRHFILYCRTCLSIKSIEGLSEFYHRNGPSYTEPQKSIDLLKMKLFAKKRWRFNEWLTTFIRA